MTTLDDFDGGRTTEPPQIQKQGRIITTHGEQTRVAGWYGPTNRGVMGFVTSRDSHEHRIRALDAYAISNDALVRITDTDVGVILVVEQDTDDVFEYDIEDFTKYGSPVGEKFLSRRDDQQTYATRDEAKDKWTDHRSQVYIPRGADLDMGVGDE